VLLSALQALRDGVVADEATRNVLLDVVQLAFGTQLTPLPLVAAIVVHGSHAISGAAALQRLTACLARFALLPRSRCRHCSRSRTRNAPLLASRCPNCAALRRRALSARCLRCSVQLCAATPVVSPVTRPRWPAPRPYSCVWRRLVRDVDGDRGARHSARCAIGCVAQPH
jgi:hypothetical protein